MHLVNLFHLIVVGAIAFNINVRSIDDEQLQEVLNCEIEGRVSISVDDFAEAYDNHFGGWSNFG